MSDTDVGPALRAAGRLLQDIDDHARRLIDDCRGVLRLLGPAGAGLDRLLGRVGAAADDAVRLVRPLIEHPGDPASLALAGARWRFDVARPVQLRVDTFTADFATIDEHWRGAAADAYLAALPPQHAAMAAIQDIAYAVADSLDSSSNALIAFWLTALPALSSTAAELFAAAVLAGNPVTAPVGAAAALAALEGCIAAVGGLVTALSTVLGEQAQRQAALLTRLADPALFPSGRWPVVVASLMWDASLTDGSPSDWSLLR